MALRAVRGTASDGTEVLVTVYLSDSTSRVVRVPPQTHLRKLARLVAEDIGVDVRARFLSCSHAFYFCL